MNPRLYPMPLPPRGVGRARSGSFYVYVVLLHKPNVPGRSVYVGSSAYPPDVRFRKHGSGAMSTSRHVRKYGVRLLPELYAHLNPLLSREAAKETERRLRASLERRGYRVYGACYPREEACLL